MVVGLRGAEHFPVGAILDVQDSKGAYQVEVVKVKCMNVFLPREDT